MHFARDMRGMVLLLPRLRDEGWSGLLTDPRPDIFAGLEPPHPASERVVVWNFALSDISGMWPRHSLSIDAQLRLPMQPRGRASFDVERLVEGGAGTDEVLRMGAVLTELGIDRAQLLAINAGGAGALVLRGFDLAGMQPSVCLGHARPGTPEDAACIAALPAGGLVVFRIGDHPAGPASGVPAVPMDELLTFFNRVSCRRRCLNDRLSPPSRRHRHYG